METISLTVKMWKILLLAFVAKPVVIEENDCRIKITSDDKNAKLYFNVFRWTNPRHNLGTAVEYIKHGTPVELTCENGFVRDDLIANTYTFECTNGKFNKTLPYEDLLCRSNFHKDTKTYAISPTQFGSKIFKCDQRGWQAYQVKARKADGKERLLYTVCYDRNVLKSKFVFQPKRSDNPERSNATRIDVWGMDRFGTTIRDKTKLTEGYVARIQKVRITKAFPEKYNTQNPYPYTFNRGHLAPYADFIDLEDKKASCLYLNVAPQWREFNSNSWASIERKARGMVKNNTIEWEIYTGTYGDIPTTKGPLYVSPLFDEDGKYIKSYVPVPKLYWKIVYNTADRNKSKVFIGINNPELKSPQEFTDKYVICKPIPDKNGNKFQGSEFKGFIYNCDLEDFLEKLKADEKIVK